jgi:Fe-S oxidoreductase
MAVKQLKDFEEVLYGCRFCPMCKPAAEVANEMHIESYSTRARGMLLWRYIHGMTDLSPRAVELLYQSTLDSISEAWCVNHYPVSTYIVSARAEVFAKGLAPKTVLSVLDRPLPKPGDIKGETLLLASEAAELDDPSLLQPAVSFLEKYGRTAEVVMMGSGAVEYCLGAIEQAEELARRVCERISLSGAGRVITDGPQTLWALKYVYPILEKRLPEGIVVTSISEEITRCLDKHDGRQKDLTGKKVIFHDSRSACLLADDMARDPAIQPGFGGPETTMGTGEVYEAPRRLIDRLGLERVFSVWTRSLSKSCGADDGLWLTYPNLAEKLARKRLSEAREQGAEMIAADSLLCASYLSKMCTDSDVEVCWFPELIG